MDVRQEEPVYEQGEDVLGAHFGGLAGWGFWQDLGEDLGLH